MLDVHEDRIATLALNFGDDGETEGRLTRGLWAEDLDDTTAGEAADAQGEVDGDGAGRDGGDRHLGGVAHAHERAVPVLLVDGGEGEVERLALGGLRGRFFFGCGVGLGDGHGREVGENAKLPAWEALASKMNKCSLLSSTPLIPGVKS